MKSLVFVFVVVFGGVARAQVIDSQEGRRRLESYILQTSSSLGDYACRQQFSISTDANAPVLMASNATLVFAMVGKDGFEALQAANEVLDGEWESKEEKRGGSTIIMRSVSPPLTSGSFEMLRTRTGYYNARQDSLDPSGEWIYGMGGTSRSPFMEWPVMLYTYLRNRKAFGLDKTPSELAKEWHCVSSEMKGGKLVATFKDHELGVPYLELRLTFDEDLIVRSEWFLVGSKLRRLISDVATRWDTSLSDPLPKHVHAKMDTMNPETGFMDYVIDFEWYFDGSPEFAELKTRVQKLRSKLGQEREIAGAEQPKAAEKPKK